MPPLGQGCDTWRGGSADRRGRRRRLRCGASYPSARRRLLAGQWGWFRGDTARPVAANGSSRSDIVGEPLMLDGFKLATVWLVLVVKFVSQLDLCLWLVYGWLHSVTSLLWLETSAASAVGCRNQSCRVRCAPMQAPAGSPCPATLSVEIVCNTVASRGRKVSMISAPDTSHAFSVPIRGADFYDWGAQI